MISRLTNSLFSFNHIHTTPQGRPLIMSMIALAPPPPVSPRRRIPKHLIPFQLYYDLSQKPLVPSITMRLHESIRLFPDEKIRHQAPQPVTAILVIPNTHRIIRRGATVGMISNPRHLVDDRILAGRDLQDVDQTPQTDQAEVGRVCAGQVFVAERAGVEPLDEELEILGRGFWQAEVLAGLRLEKGVGGVEGGGEEGADRKEDLEVDWKCFGRFANVDQSQGPEEMSMNGILAEAAKALRDARQTGLYLVGVAGVGKVAVPTGRVDL